MARTDASPPKAARLNIRTNEGEKALVESAARAAHVSASRFIMEAAVRSAEDVLADRTRFVLPAAEWARFTEALDRPARVVPALRRAASRPSPFEDV